MAADIVTTRAREDTLAKRLLSGGAWTLVFKVLTAGLSLVANAMLARMIPPEEFGTYVLALSLAMFGGTLGTLGLKVSIVRLLAESTTLGDYGRARRVLRTGLALVGAGAATVCCMFVVCSDFVLARFFDAEVLFRLAAIVGLFMAVQSLGHFVSEALRGFHELRLASMFSGPQGGPIGMGLFVLSLAGLWWLGQPTLAAILILALIAAALSLLVAGYLLGRVTGQLAGKESVSNSDLTVPTSRYLLAESTPFLVTSMLFLLRVNAPVWIVAALCSGSDLALFGAVHRLMNAMLLPLSVVSEVVPASIVELHTRSEKEGLQRVLRATATAAGLPTAAALVLFAVGSHWLLGTIFGAFYADGARLVWIISAGQLIFVLGGTPAPLLAMTGRQRALVVITLCTAVALLVGGTWATYRFGIEGMAWTICVTQVVAKIASVVYARFSLGIWTHAELRPRSIIRIIGQYRAKLRSA